jgi:hypothetical protein
MSNQVSQFLPQCLNVPTSTQRAPQLLEKKISLFYFLATKPESKNAGVSEDIHYLSKW